MMDRDTYISQTHERVAHVMKDLRSSPDDERFERLVHQAEVSMDKLTGSPEWDSFVQIVQSRIETAKDDYEHMAYELAHPSFRVGIEDMTRQRIALAELHSTIAALEWITELPREIIDAAEAAGLDDEDVAAGVDGDRSVHLFTAREDVDSDEGIFRPGVNAEV